MSAASEEALAAIVAANLFERITMNVKPPKPAPDHVLRMLKTKGESRYSRFVTVFHCLEIHEGVFVGVVGDGDNGSYEWFLVEQGKLTHSDSGYGISESALRDVLINEV